MIGRLAEHAQAPLPAGRGNRNAAKSVPGVAPEGPAEKARRDAFFSDHEIPKPGPRVRYERERRARL